MGIRGGVGMYWYKCQGHYVGFEWNMKAVRGCPEHSGLMFPVKA